MGCNSMECSHGNAQRCTGRDQERLGRLYRRLNQEAAKTIRYGGANEDEALKMITLNAAWIIGGDDQVGSLDAGQDADIVIWDGYPPSSYGIPEKVLIDGDVYFDRSLPGYGMPYSEPNVPKHDLKLEALLPYLRGKRPVVLAAEEANDLETAVHLANEFHLKFVLNHIIYSKPIMRVVT